MTELGMARKRNEFMMDENIRTKILANVIQVTGKSIADMNRVLWLIWKTWEENPTKNLVQLNELAVQRILKDIKDMKAAEESQKVATIRDVNDVLPRVTILTNSAVRNPETFVSPYRYRVFLGSTNDPYGANYSGSNPVLRRIKNIRLVGGFIPNIYKISGGSYIHPVLYVRIDEIPSTYTSLTYANAQNIVAELRFRLDTTTTNNDFLLLDDVGNYFNRPFRDIDTINTLQQLTINILAFDGTPLDQVITQTSDFALITSGSSGNPVQFTTATAHNLVTGERITIVGYKTAPSGDVADAAINRSAGYNVLAVIDAFNFTVDVTTNGIGGGGYVFKMNRQSHITFEFESYVD